MIMKKIYYFFLAALFTMGLSSCEEDEDPIIDIQKPTISNVTPEVTEVQTLGGTFTITATVTDNEAVRAIRIWNTAWGVDSTFAISGASASVALDIIVPTNADASIRNIFKMKAWDHIRNESEAELLINLGADSDSEAPVVTVLLPAGGVPEVHPGQPLEVLAEVTDNLGLNKIDFSIPSLSFSQTLLAGGVTLYNIIQTGDQAFSIPNDLALGTYVANIVATDIAGNSTAQEIPFEVVERPGPENLYLVGGSSSAGWDPPSSIPFVKIEEGVFEMYAWLNSDGGGIKFLEVQDWAGDWGLKPGTDNELEQEGEDNVPVAENGFYRIHVDYNTGTFSLTKTIWGVIGDATPGGWDADTDMTYKSGYTWYIQGITLTDGQMKFRANDDWPINFGAGATESSLLFNSPDNIPVTAGTYTIEMTLDPVNGYTYKLLSGPSNLYLVGGSTLSGWDPPSSVPFTKTGDGTFVIYAPLTSDGGGFKLLELQDWPGDWGLKPGTTNELEQEGEDNIPVAETGFYRISVDYNTLTFSMEKLNFSIIGDATPGGWGTDTGMTHEGGYTWSVTGITLTNGEMKFRANNDWAVNFGLGATEGSLLFNSPSNISVSASAGTVTVKMILDPVNGYTYTIE